MPRAAAAAFEAAVARTLGGDARRALASLAAKHVMPALSPQDLRELGVLRVVQPPGYAVVTLPVRAVLCRLGIRVQLSILALSPAELQELGVLRVVQPSGYAVVTPPVRAALCCLIWRCVVLPN